MGSKTGIEWTDATWGAIRARRWDWDRKNPGSGVERLGWHCEKVSEGCKNCYAETLNLRWGTLQPFKPGHLKHRLPNGDARGDVEIFLDQKLLELPMRWRGARMIFVNSMTDLFADFVTDEMIASIFAVMTLAPQHVYQILTKRPARMRRFMTDGHYHEKVHDALARFYVDVPDRARQWLLDAKRASAFGGAAFPLPHVWLGVSAEDKATLEERVPDLLATPAAVRFLSAEPLLGPLHLSVPARKLGENITIMRNALTGVDGAGQQGGAHLDWVICGGESGAGARPMHPDWARSLRDQCAEAGVAFFFKQWGEWAPHPSPEADGASTRVGKKAAGRLLDGLTHIAMPERRP